MKSSNDILSFCWDRTWSANDLRARLAAAPGPEWVRLAAWIMREARTEEVWQFLRVSEVRDRLAELEPFLGRRKEFWRYILRTWHELGKI